MVSFGQPVPKNKSLEVSFFVFVLDFFLKKRAERFPRLAHVFFGSK